MNEVNFTLKHCYVLVTGSTTLTGILTPICVGFFLLLKQRKKNSLLEFETLDLTSHLVSVMIKKKASQINKEQVKLYIN